MKRCEAEYVKHSPRIGIDNWELALDYDIIEKFIKDQLKALLDVAVKEYECHVYFPFSYSQSFQLGDIDCSGDDGLGGSPVDDPLTIYVGLPLGSEEYEDPTWKFTLTGMVDNLIDDHVDGVTGKIEHDNKAAIAVRDGLRALAEKIDGYLEKSDDQPEGA